MSDILKLPGAPDTPGTFHAGWDFVITKPGEMAEIPCRVCGKVMEARRGVIGPTGWAHAMAINAGAATDTPHDEFTCQHSGETWHRQALALKLEARKTSSGQVEQMLLGEADEIIRTRTATRQM